MHPEIPINWQRVLGAVVTGPVAWRTPAEVASEAGGGVEETTDVLAELDVAGWVEVWEREEGPAVTLSPLAAARMLLRLVEGGTDQDPRWSRVGTPLPKGPRSGSVGRCSAGDPLAAALDPHPGPLQSAIHGERSLREQCSDLTPGTAPPRPTLLIGQGLVPWPGPARSKLPPCPACAGVALKPHMYCLCCDGWGRDCPGIASPPTRFKAPHADARRVDGERHRRRSRRRARFQAATKSA